MHSILTLDRYFKVRQNRHDVFLAKTHKKWNFFFFIFSAKQVQHYQKIRSCVPAEVTTFG